MNHFCHSERREAKRNAVEESRYIIFKVIPRDSSAPLGLTTLIRWKKAFDTHGITSPRWEVIGSSERPTIPLPIVVKPPRQGSTVGVVIVKSENELAAAMTEAAKYDREFLIEEFVQGRELTIGI